MEKFQPNQLTRQAIDDWPVPESGLSARVVHCLGQADVKTIGHLRDWNDKQLLKLTNFGSTSLDNIRWFFGWTRRLEAGNGHIASFRALLREFLNQQEVFVLEQRYGLTDPLFRPHMKRRTLQEIAEMHIRVTRERVRQIEESGIAALRSRLARAVGESQEIYWANRVLSRGCVVASSEVSEWAGDPMLGGYQPWGALLLLSETLERITFRYDYFSVLPDHVLNQVEKQILQLLHNAKEPVPFEKILASVSDELSFLNGQRPRLVTVLLDHHPEISGTVDRLYFLPMLGAPQVIVDILRGRREPVHFHELTRLYNERMLPHSRKGTGYILRVLNLMPEARRVSRAVYELKG
ncbi:MAG TPA: DNA-directed RNA polymerase subunit alpha C-terminal domain-containing protein [Verrucomicrobiae bacterium]|nr:DNA-directed RNA polymerase subunit alpha C-terminal domain-containing protein [Verrucomicrobiae bacterium]